MTKTTLLMFSYWEMNNKQQSCRNDNCMSRTQEQKGFILVNREAQLSQLSQFRIIVFISKFVRLHGVLSFQNKHVCVAICGPRCERLMSHLQVRINEAGMLYLHPKLPDAARGTNSENLGNVFVFVWTYKIECTCFENYFCPSLLAKSKKKLNLPETLGY